MFLLARSHHFGAISVAIQKKKTTCLKNLNNEDSPEDTSVVFHFFTRAQAQNFGKEQDFLSFFLLCIERDRKKSIVSTFDSYDVV